MLSLRLLLRDKNIPFVFSELDKMLIGKDVMLALAKKREIDSFK